MSDHGHVIELNRWHRNLSLYSGSSMVVAFVLECLTDPVVAAGQPRKKDLSNDQQMSQH